MFFEWLKDVYDYYIAEVEPAKSYVVAPKQKQSSVIKKKGRIALSYAHNSISRGAGYAGVFEHELSKKWTNELYNILINRGFDVLLVPIGELKNKVAFINQNSVDIAIEIHFNGSSDPFITGVETLYSGSKKGSLLAGCVHNQYAPEMNNNNRGVKIGYYRMDKNNKIDYFLRATNCPAIILEPDFISQIINIRESQSNAVIAMADGIEAYFGELNGN